MAGNSEVSTKAVKFDTFPNCVLFYREPKGESSFARTCTRASRMTKNTMHALDRARAFAPALSHEVNHCSITPLDSRSSFGIAEVSGSGTALLLLMLLLACLPNLHLSCNGLGL